jgi:hypothetical protein
VGISQLKDINIRLNMLWGVNIHQFIDSNKEQEKKMTIGKRRREKKKRE